MQGLLDAMALAIFDYEGSHPHDRNHRNNNPGNLRLTGNGYPRDVGGYTIFPTFTEGYVALIQDIRAKIWGDNDHGLNMDSTLEDFFKVYAPSSDANNPLRYAWDVARWLGAAYFKSFHPQDTFAYILETIGEKKS